MTLPASIGRYAITGEIGRGAMGVVYRAVDPTLDRPVAVKVIAARTAAVPLSGEELEARFVREARMASRISHPGVVIVHDAGREGDRLYLVMELIEGESLAERLARREFPPPMRSKSWQRSPTCSAPPMRSGSCTATSSRGTSCWPGMAG